MFNALDLDGSNTVSSIFFVNFLRKAGLMIKEDPRLDDCAKYMAGIKALDRDVPLTLEQFA